MYLIDVIYKPQPKARGEKYIHLLRLTIKKKGKQLVSNQKQQSLKLSLLGLSSQVGHQNIAQLSSGLVDVVAHAVSAETLADDVEVQAGSISMVRIYNGVMGLRGLTCSR